MDALPNSDHLIRWLNKHLVSLTIIYGHLDENGKPTGKPYVAACSSFVLAFGDIWFLVTAGHVIKDLDKLFANPRVKVLKTFIEDSLGAQATHLNSIPFNYADSHRHPVYEDGLDFGLIVLTPNERRLMQANGVHPVEVANWVNQDLNRCRGFLLLGMPADLVKPEDPEASAIKYGTVAIALRRLRELPDGAQETKFERFIGDVGGEVDLEHGLEGTSGAPILGFFDEDGTLKYWVVALQSHCLRKRFVFGCPVKTIGHLIMAEANALLDDMDPKD